MLEPGLITIVDYVRAIDGDTIEFKIERTFKVRVRGVDAVELRTEHGKEARDYVNNVLKNADEIKIFIPSNDPHKLMDIQSFERLVADVYVDGISLVELIKTGGFEKKVLDK